MKLQRSSEGAHARSDHLLACVRLDGRFPLALHASHDPNLFIRSCRKMLLATTTAFQLRLLNVQIHRRCVPFFPSCIR